MNDSKDLKEKNNVANTAQVEEPTNVVETNQETKESNEKEGKDTEIIAMENNKDSNKTKEAKNTTDENLEKNEETPLDNIELSHMDANFVLECLSVPTHSRLEFRMVAFIMLWARRNNVLYEFDDYGNLYLTKGKLGEGEYFPCVTSHLDTVQNKQEPYIYAGVPLDLQIEITKDNEHKVSVTNTGGSKIGIGADDKAGVAICLSLFEHFEKIKACFFLEEETGCDGSKHLWKEWFEDVGYVIGYDSPDLYRAAYACSGTKLFSYKFYETYMKDVCDSWGLTKGHFHSEPFTDVKEIREKIGVICMNFGNGGYNPHSETEYCILEHMNQACAMGVDLIDKIGCTRHYLENRSKWDKSNSFIRNEDGIYISTIEDDDEKLESLSNKKTYSSSSSSSSSYSSTSLDDQLKFESVKYIVNRYESYIGTLKKDVLETIKAVCESSNIDFALFEEKITQQFDSDIKF